MGHKAKIMYIERKAGNLTGPARIGRVTYSKTGATIYYRGQEFRSLKGSGFKANYYEVVAGEEYWISGPRTDGEDALYPTNIATEIDADVSDEESGPLCQDNFPAAIRLWIGESEIGR